MPVSTIFKPCALIPCYNHGSTLEKVLASLIEHGVDCIIVDDGSDSHTQKVLKEIQQKYPQCYIRRSPKNQGKGHALMTGFKLASTQGYSHALQIDADGQHALNDVSTLLKMAQETPNMLISGRPVYDDSVPKMRLYGRYITHFFVWLETLSFSLKDSMCGFRVYPLKETLAVMDKYSIGQRMDFDPEIMVRLYWSGTPSRFLATRVHYPENGISHFNVLKDNLRISWMHTRLLLGMLWRFPRLLLNTPSYHWANTNERRGLWGMRFMLWVYRVFGRKPFQFFLFFVVACFWMCARGPRRYSREYLQKVKTQLRALDKPIPKHLNSFCHFWRFSNAMLDKIACWNGKFVWNKDVVFASGTEAVLGEQATTGKLIIASHLGDIEVCRALAETGYIKRVNALVFHEHATRFNKIISEIAPQANINVISVAEIGVDTIFFLQEKIAHGEWCAIVGDRIAISSSLEDARRITWSVFLGQLAPFPQGPFILASLLKCPVVLMFALKLKGMVTIYGETFASPLVLPRCSREEALQTWINYYAKRLEYYTLVSPLDWFNFYHFWQLPSEHCKLKENL